MSMRRRLLRSYLVVIFLAFFYIAFSFAMSTFRLQMEKDKNALMEVNILWGNMLVFMNESMSNWKNGQTYEHFVTNTDAFDTHLAELVREKERGPRFRGKVFDHLENLHTVWKLAKVNVELIRTTRESPSFRRVEDLLTRKPGLQRLYPAYMRMIFNPGSNDTSLSFALKEYIDAVEFFPIYGDTINYLFMIIFATMDQEYTRLRMIQNIVVGVFLIIFIMGIVYTTRHFTNSLASPIIKLSNKLNSFIGKSVESRLLVESDELVHLESSVDELIAHYTHLSKLAYRLSVGSI